MIQTYIDLVVVVLIVFFVWFKYRKKSYAASQMYSTFWPRFWANFVDAVVLGFLHGIGTLVFTIWTFEKTLCIYAVFALFPYVYSIVLHGKYGQTIGKMVCKVKVTDLKTHSRIGFSKAALRDAVPIVITAYPLIYPAGLGLHMYYTEGILIAWSLIELLTMLTNRRRRALHDLIAGTIVVRTRIREQETPAGDLKNNYVPTPVSPSPIITSSKSTSRDQTPLDILKKRYAKGEITKEEFDKIKEDLQRE
jgi:uncharacterized RDD family membrane protein YckC